MFSDVIPLGLCRLKFVYCLSILFACSSGLCPSVYYCFRVLSLMGHLVSNIFTFYGSCWRIGAKSWFLIFTFSWFELHVESCNCFSELFPRSWKALSNHPGAFFSPLNFFFLKDGFLSVQDWLKKWTVIMLISRVTISAWKLQEIVYRSTVSSTVSMDLIL